MAHTQDLDFIKPLTSTLQNNKETLSQFTGHQTVQVVLLACLCVATSWFKLMLTFLLIFLLLACYYLLGCSVWLLTGPFQKSTIFFVSLDRYVKNFVSLFSSTMLLHLQVIQVYNFQCLHFSLWTKCKKIAMLLKVLTKISPGSDLKLILVLMTNEWQMAFNRVNYRDYRRRKCTAPDRVSVSFRKHPALTL